MKDYIEIAILLILLDRSILIRNHYKFAIEYTKDKYVHYWALWIYCKQAQKDTYGRYGGKRILYINFK